MLSDGIMTDTAITVDVAYTDKAKTVSYNSMIFRSFHDKILLFLTELQDESRLFVENKNGSSRTQTQDICASTALAGALHLVKEPKQFQSDNFREIGRNL